ncbi:MAG: hypothetical protein JNJ49_09435, partial [Bdellovibrionaceae bacterium]|nr:hypothetical protein [Pseudobdellovibrionaceae bacterium]
MRGLRATAKFLAVLAVLPLFLGIGCVRFGASDSDHSGVTARSDERVDSSSGGGTTVVGSGGNAVEAEARTLLSEVVAAWRSSGLADLGGVRLSEFEKAAQAARIVVIDQEPRDVTGQGRDAVNISADRIWIYRKAFVSNSRDQKKALIVHELLGHMGMAAKDDQYKLSTFLIQGPEYFEKATVLSQYLSRQDLEDTAYTVYWHVCDKGLMAAQRFVALGGDINAFGERANLHERTLLSAAVFFDCEAYVKWAIAQGATINKRLSENGPAALMISVLKNRVVRESVYITEHLVAAGADAKLSCVLTRGG